MINTRALISIYSLIAIVLAANSGKDEAPENEGGENLDFPYCFRFTWVGSKYYKESQIKKLTCDDLTNGGKGVPCRPPLVATSNGDQLPDTDWMWDQYKINRDEIACRMTGGDLCVKYSYIYNKVVENITYMCGKVHIDGEGASNGGCYSTYRDGKEIEVCACKSIAGRTPCNSANLTQSNFLGFMISVVLLSLVMLSTLLY